MQKIVLILSISLVSIFMAAAQSIVPVSFNAGSSQTNGKIILTAAIGNSFIPTDYSTQQDIIATNLIIKTEKKINNPEMVKIFPNPANEIIYFENKSSKILRINLYNSTGQLIKTQADGTNHSGTLRISDLQQGIYFVHFILEHSQTQTVKLIKN